TSTAMDFEVPTGEGRKLSVFLDGNILTRGGQLQGITDWDLATIQNGDRKDIEVKRLDDLNDDRPGFEPEPAASILRQILQHAGASLPGRDAVDQRIVRETIAGFRGAPPAQQGDIIDSETQKGGLPTLLTAAPPPDSDMDGIPDHDEATGITSRETFL